VNHKSTITSFVKDDKRVMRWEHIKPLECECCHRVALYRVYVRDSNSHIGARMTHLCDVHYNELSKLVDLLPIKIKEDRVNYPQVKSALGNVIRDTDDGALSDTEWQEHLHPKRTRTGVAKKDKQPVGPPPKPSLGILSLVKLKDTV
jgi:hypothetical protein